jgi:hypothetical protein
MPPAGVGGTNMASGADDNPELRNTVDFSIAVGTALAGGPYRDRLFNSRNPTFRNAELAGRPEHGGMTQGWCVPRIEGSVRHPLSTSGCCSVERAWVVGAWTVRSCASKAVRVPVGLGRLSMAVGWGRPASVCCGCWAAAAGRAGWRLGGAVGLVDVFVVEHALVRQCQRISSHRLLRARSAA